MTLRDVDKVDKIDRELAQLRERMNRLFDESMASMRTEGGATWTPSADIYRAGDRLIVTLELPGLEEGQVMVEEIEGALRVRGRRPVISTGAAALQLERSYGAFARDFALPAAARVQDRTERFADGVLRIEIPIGESEPG